MLDTNIVSHFMRYPDGQVAKIIRKTGDAGLCVSVIVVAELRYGVAKVGSTRLARQVDFALATLDIVPFEPPADQIYADIRTALERKGTVIGPNDLWIAAHALALDLPLIAANIGEFSRVPNLRVENWLD
ncbi:MAG TPA: type II toxin-antitoxin system VapC family toxin [Devosia sp.]|nr:type II toxin-antitoxin system VapC family toxin [Devosia sp.]